MVLLSSVALNRKVPVEGVNAMSVRLRLAPSVQVPVPAVIAPVPVEVFVRETLPAIFIVVLLVAASKVMELVPVVFNRRLPEMV